MTAGSTRKTAGNDDFSKKYLLYFHETPILVSICEKGRKFYLTFLLINNQMNVVLHLKFGN